MPLWPRNMGIALISVALGTAACGSDSGEDAGPINSGTAGASAGTAGSPELAERAEELLLQARTTAPLVPREQRELTVTVRPSAAHTVRFLLVDAGDAALDRGTLVTDTTGRGTLWLTAPSTTGTFTVRASVGTLLADLTLSVSPRELTTIEIVPRYGGRRTVTEWVASVHVGRTCSDFLPVPRESNTYVRFAPGEIGRIAKIPLGPELAVTLRAGQFASGCTQVRAGSIQDRLSVDVPVTDRPLSLAQTQLELALGLSAQDTAFTTVVARGVDSVSAAFRGDATDDASALLDAMEASATGSARSRFQVARNTGAWDTLLANPTNSGAAALGTTLARWVEVGRTALLSTRAFEGRLSPNAEDPTVAELAIDRVGQVSADRIGANAEMTSWAADPSDTLSFKGVVSWDHARLIGELALGPATAETGATTVPAALASVARCDALAGRLAREASAAELTASCDVTCLATLCKTALLEMWTRALAESPATLNLAAAGGSTIGEQAQAVGLDGNWVGKLVLNEEMRETGGEMRGSAPRYTAR
ncbi:MAG TPA: hypothetical protein VIM73_18145 [Polyangiaceae bacterium]